MSDDLGQPDSSEAASVIEILRRRAVQQPQQCAFVFLQDGETDEVLLTYADLDTRARAIAAQLQAMGAGGERALLLYAPGCEYIAAFFGCLYAGTIAVPVYPPDPLRLERTWPRLRAIINDARPSLVLSTAWVQAMAEELFAQDPDLRMRWLATDDPAIHLAEKWQQPGVDGQSLAFLQYTSGSTATPRGVKVSHRNILVNEQMIQRAFRVTEHSIVVGWLPLYHDMGLIGNVLQTLYAGCRCVLMSPLDFMAKPFRWLDAISRYRGTISGGPNFAYDLCARKITVEERAVLNLSSWQLAFNGSEPVREETLRRFADAFAPCGFRPKAFYPCYGLAEATLFVAGSGRSTWPITLLVNRVALGQGRVETARSSDADVQLLVSSGRSPSDQRIAIVNPETLDECPAGRVGEIWVAGPNVAQGYWDRTEETAHTFQAHLKGGQGPFLRTGDLGFGQDGQLYVTGRLKDLMIIRGRNHYPQDIEHTVEQSHPALRPGAGAAFPVELDGEERVIVAHEIDRRAIGVNPEEVFQAIRKAVAEEHDLSVYGAVLLQPGSIPKTSSGKIQRHACRAAFLSDSLEVIAKSVLAVSATDVADESNRLTRQDLLATDEPTELLLAYLQRQLATVLRVPQSQITPQQPITALGLDSLTALELKHEIETRLDIVLPLAQVLQGPSLAQLASQVLELTAAPSRPSASLAPREAVSEYPLSYGQRALWFVHKIAPQSAAYNIANAVRINSELDVAKLRRAFQTLVNRHPALRTLLVERNGEPVQRVCADAVVCFQAEDASTWSQASVQARLTEEAHRPFDLERGPLLRIHLLTRSSCEHILLLVVHHIAADFWSLAVLVHELGEIYQAEIKGTMASLAPPAAQYSDYVRWQAEMLAEQGEGLWAFWKQQLAGELPILNLPFAQSRPPLQTFRGATRSQRLSTELTEKIKRLSRAHGVTLYTVLLAAFQVLLHRYTGQMDIRVGSPTAGRSRAQLARLVGYLVNPVVLQGDCSGNPTFAAFLNRVRQNVLAAFAHQDYPFGLLVERLEPKRDPSASPLFQVMFVLQQAPHYEPGLAPFALGQTGASMELAGLPIESIALESHAAQFDLTLTMADVNGQLGASWQYNTDLFDGAAVARMAGHLETLLECLTANPEQRLSDLQLLTNAERHQLLVEWNDTDAAFEECCLHELFQAQAARTPDAVALVADEQHLTYREINGRANRLARHLQTLGVGPERLAGICVERSAEMIIGLLGILKAGGAYVPLDPAYPAERRAFMLADTLVSVLLTQRRLAPLFASCVAQIVCLDDESTFEQDAENLPARAASHNLAYVIYTSGSTGRPKGVAIEHHSAATLIQWAGTVFDREWLAGVLAATSICFDLSVFELFVPLSYGGTVTLAETVLHLPSLPTAQAVTLVNTVPSAIKDLLRVSHLPASVRIVNLAGEPLPTSLVQQIHQQEKIQWVYDLYGPSEDTTYSTYARRNVTGPATIGRPVAKTQLYLLDSAMQPVPLRVPGEIYLGGEGLARGYLNQPDLTAERFVPDPFSLKPGARLYRTGDLACYLPDGNLEFLGRLDDQVKLRGFRIELGEIQAHLDQQPEVQENVVAVREEASGDKRLVAYLVPKPGQSIDIGELRNSLRNRLPEYMVPSAFVLLEALPRAPNGKVDRRALPAPESARPPLETAFVAPRTSVEERLARIWSQALGLEQIGVHDNFFDLGGHSLLLVQVAARIQDAFQIELPLSRFIARPSIADLAIAVETILIEEIESVSEEEAMALLKDR